MAGFVLVPFGLFGRTAFLAEKVLGNVVSSGIKVLVLAVIIGIGSTIFGQFTTGFNNPPTINDALTLILASLSLLGLSIFGPGIANGLIAGGPQLGAGAAVGTGLAAAGLGAAGAVGAVAAGRAFRRVPSPGQPTRPPVSREAPARLSGWRVGRSGEGRCLRRFQPPSPGEFRPSPKLFGRQSGRRPKTPPGRRPLRCGRKRSNAGLGAPDATTPKHRPRRHNGRKRPALRRPRRQRPLH